MKTRGSQLKKYDKLPYRQLFIITVSRFAEPVCFTVIFPFVVSMVRDFGIAKTEQQVGFYVGLITASFVVSQMLSSIHWGILSDRFGRRPIILVGLLGTITSILSFGLSKSFLWALLSRSLCGLLNGNLGAMKSMVAELTVKASPADKTRAFSLLTLVYGLGSMLGPVFGGFLSYPVTKYPDIFGDLGFVTEILTDFPYFLPCLASAGLCAYGWLVAFFFLEETLATKIARVNPGEEEEEQALFSGQDRNYGSAANDRHFPSSQPPTLRESLTPAVILAILCHVLFAFQGIFHDELTPIWSASAREIGGLGLTSNEIGSALAFSGGVILVAQLVLLPWLTERFGLVRPYQAALLMLVFVYGTQGSVRYLYDGSSNRTNIAVWVGLMVHLGIKTILHTVVSTGCTILINNASPRLDALGSINGVDQCVASGMRAIGSVTCGIVWSSATSATSLFFWFRIEIPFWFLALVSTTTFYFAKRLNITDYEK